MRLNERDVVMEEPVKMCRGCSTVYGGGSAGAALLYHRIKLIAYR